MYNNPYNSMYNPMQPMNMPQGVNPYMPQARQPAMELTRVTGIQGAQAYQMPPNSTAALFDSGCDIMYIKTTDGAGFPTIRTFEFKPYEEPAAMPAPEYATKADLMALREELMANGKQSVRKPEKSAKPDTAE